MALLKKAFDGMLYKGGLMGAGILGVLLWRRLHLPEYMSKIFIIITSIGICSSIWHILKGKDQRQGSSGTKRKQTIRERYQKVVSQLEERWSQQENGDGARRREGVGLANGDDLPSRAVNPKEVAGQIRKLSALFKGKDISQHGNFLKTCAEVFEENKASKPVSQGNAEAGEASEIPIKGEVDEALMRKLVMKQYEALVKACTNVGAEENGTADVGEGVVFQASDLFKDWDTRRPDIEKELAAVLRNGKVEKLRKTPKVIKGKMSPPVRKKSNK